MSDIKKRLRKEKVVTTDKPQNNNEVQTDSVNEELYRLEDQIRNYMINKYTKAVNNPDFDEETYKSYIEQYLKERGTRINSMNQRQLVEYMYDQLRGYSLITPFLDDPDVEEVNINSWQDITIEYSSSVSKAKAKRLGIVDGLLTLDKHFSSPENAKEIVDKLLRKEEFGNKLDRGTPIIRGHFGTNKRITASCCPVLDKDRGVQANIRMINPQTMGREDFIKKGTATSEIYQFLLGCLLCRLSEMFIGETSSGKTTMLSSLLGEMPNETRIITIENETREFDLVRWNEDKTKIINNVIHWVTTEKYDQEKLLEYALTTNPKVICLAEMKSEEAFAVSEACRTGHTVLTTIHAKNCRAAYNRMATLCLLKGLDISYEILYNLCIESFPIAVMLRQLDDKSRKIVEITESYLDENHKPQTKTIYRFKTTEKIYNDAGDVIKINGEYIKENNLSERLIKEFEELGFDTEFLNDTKAGETIKSAATDDIMEELEELMGNIPELNTESSKITNIGTKRQRPAKERVNMPQKRSVEA